MAGSIFPQWRTRLRLRVIALALLAGILFLADTITRLEIAVAVLYVAVVLLAMWIGPRKWIAPVGAACAVLTVTSFALTKNGDAQAGAANLALSLVAIGATTYLAGRIGLADEKQRQAQAQLAHASRLTTLGELSAGISHEVSQPLAAIVANGNAALRWHSMVPPNEQEVQKALERLVRDADRAGSILRRVRRLAERRALEHTAFDARDLIGETLDIVRPQLLRAAVETSVHVDAGLPLAFGDRTLLQQVLLNIVLNAIQAIEKSEAKRPPRITVNLTCDERGLVLSVTDSGPGLPQHEIRRIFDPFYSTKDGGLGLGLTISRSIVEAHGGTIDATSTPGENMALTVTIPVEKAL